MKDLIHTDPLEMTFAQAAPIAGKFSSNTLNEDTANECRAKSGWLALTAYVKKAYGNPDPEPVEQGVRDLLSDLQHLCKELDLPFEDLLARARASHEEELLYPIG